MEVAMRQFWGLDIVRLNGSRRLLGTLLIQGGLPLRAIGRDGNSLQDLFRRLLDNAIATPISVEGLARLAETFSRLLPSTWRDERVYQLLAEITETTALLSAQIPKGADAIEYLDDQDDTWRDRLPISMTEEVGRALFSFMVAEAHDSAAMRRAPVRVLTVLYQAGEAWELVRRMLLPHQVTSRELAMVLGMDADTILPYRLKLYAQNDEADQQHVATATRWQQRNNDVLYLIDPRGLSRDLRLGGSLGLVAGSGTATYGPAPLDGGEDRGPLPWVFRLPRAEQHCWEMVAQGSASLRAEEALVLISEVSVPLPGADGEYEWCGEVKSRQIFRLLGKVRILADGELCRIHLGASNDDVADYSLSGSVVLGLGNREPVFRGPPMLRASTGGHRYGALRRGRQEWRRSGEPWNDTPSKCLGRIELRHVVDDETLHVRRGLHVTPSSFSYVAKPDPGGSSGRLQILGLGVAVTAEFVSDDSFLAEKCSKNSECIEWSIKAEGDCVARYAALRVHWTHGASSTLQLPLPIADARFITVDGQVLPDSANVTLDEAHRVIAEVVGAPGLVRDARLLIRLHDHQLPHQQRTQLDANMSLHPLAGQTGVARLELSRILDEIRLRFAASQRPDARVEIDLDLQGHRRRVRIQRFPYGIRFDRETSEIVVERSEPAQEELTIQSFPVNAPGADLIFHTPSASGRWRVDPELLRTGARLGVARADGRPMTSTVLLSPPRERVVPDDQEVPQEPVVIHPPRGLADASQAPTLRLRGQAFTTVLDHMVKEIRDPDWKLLDAYVYTLGDLHAVTFDVIESLITRPRAVVIALLRAPHSAVDRIWSALEDLPFAWHLVPVRDWVRGIAAWFEWSSDRLEDRDLPLSRIEQLSEFMAPRLPSSKLVFHLVHSALHGQVDIDIAVQQLGLLVSAAARAPRQVELLEAKIALLRDMATRAEATASQHYNWPSGPMLSRIVESAIEALTPDLSDLLINDELGFRIPLLNAPIVAAMWVAAPDQLVPEQWNLHLDIDISRRELLFELRRMRASAPRWYDKCFELTLFETLGRRRRDIFRVSQ